MEELRLKIEEILRPLAPPGGKVALLDFPGYANPGDNAIWLGAVRILGRLGHRKIDYTCDQGSYSRDELARLVDGGTIFLTGGGNLGDLWEAHQLFRERVISEFPDQPIVQLPQSICFQSPENLKRARKVFDSHPRLTLLLRDHRSYEFARNEFRASAILCPDISFALGRLTRACKPTADILWISRTDKEAPPQRGRPLSPTLTPRDYIVDRRMPLQRVYNALKRGLGLKGPVRRGLDRAIRELHRPLAERTLVTGCRMLSSAHVVVTNRLHGHILCLLLGIPHFLSDNNYGKLSALYTTWTRDSHLACWCETEAEALSAASAYLRTGVLSPTHGVAP